MSGRPERYDKRTPTWARTFSVGDRIIRLYHVGDRHTEDPGTVIAGGKRRNYWLVSLDHDPSHPLTVHVGELSHYCDIETLAPARAAAAFAKVEGREVTPEDIAYWRLRQKANARVIEDQRSKAVRS